VGRPEGNGIIGIPRCRRKDNINTNLKEMGRGIFWINLAQNRALRMR
jgi:hypothetical protein